MILSTETASTKPASLANQPLGNQGRSFFPSLRAALAAGIAVAALMAATLGANAQATQPAAAPAQQPATAPAPQDPNTTFSNQPAGKTRKADKVVESKDTQAANKKLKKDNPLEGQNAKLPDKALYDKAIDATNHGRYDVARLDLQTLLNTYPDSPYLMRSKLAVADAWYKEGGTAALTQAEQEYKDFITFFPNVPEAAEAQMRVGDIYFKQMDKPDRDNSKAIHAEEEYRTFLQQFPDSPLLPQVTQRLREVQETLAAREAGTAAFYEGHQNWPATIARYQTVVDTYPLYSHIDDAFIGLGDAYEAEARYFRALNLPEAIKAKLVSTYNDQAIAAYRKVVLEHSAAPHVEDAKDRLSALGQPIPTPTPEQVAASTALENSRSNYTLSKLARVIFLHEPDVVQAPTIGAPPVVDPKATYAPAVIHQMQDTVQAAAAPPVSKAVAPANTAPGPNASAPAPAAAAPLAFQDVPSADAAPVGSVNTSVPASSYTGGGATNSTGLSIVQPGSSNPPMESPTAVPNSNSPAAVPENGGIKPVGPPVSTPLAPVEKPAAAPDALNEVAPGSQPAAQAAPAKGKAAKPGDVDPGDEASSKKKKKKGLDKLNPF